MIIYEFEKRLYSCKVENELTATKLRSGKVKKQIIIGVVVVILIIIIIIIRIIDIYNNNINNSHAIIYLYIPITSLKLIETILKRRWIDGTPYILRCRHDVVPGKGDHSATLQINSPAKSKYYTSVLSANKR